MNAPLLTQESPTKDTSFYHIDVYLLGGGLWFWRSYKDSKMIGSGREKTRIEAFSKAVFAIEEQ